MNLGRNKNSRMRLPLQALRCSYEVRKSLQVGYGPGCDPVRRWYCYQRGGFSNLVPFPSCIKLSGLHKPALQR